MSGALLAAFLGSSALSSIAQIFGAKSAAKAQTTAADKSIAAQLTMFGITREGLDPYVKAGVKSMDRLSAMMDWLTTPVTMDQATLEATPGYKWALGQGVKSVENALTQRGLGGVGASGASIKGAEEYAQGLASQTYQQQFQNAMANKKMAYESLYGSASLGESAASGVGTAATETGSKLGNYLTQAGQAQAASATGIANAVSSFSNSLALQAYLANASRTAGTSSSTGTG